jgi:adenylate kinase family enzyme
MIRSARRIVILGNAGSGKSTLARRLGGRLGLPVIHLDALFWNPGWTEPDAEVFRAKVREAVTGDDWVSDGNYLSRTFDLRLPRADLVIWLDTPRRTCMARVIWRTLRGGRREDLADGCREQVDAHYLEFLRYTWNFDRKSKPRLEAARAQMAPDAPVVRLRTRREVEAFVDQVSQGRSAPQNPS